jgi:hypothetical protein
MGCNFIVCRSHANPHTSPESFQRISAIRLLCPYLQSQKSHLDCRCNQVADNTENKIPHRGRLHISYTLFDAPREKCEHGVQARVNSTQSKNVRRSGNGGTLCVCRVERLARRGRPRHAPRLHPGAGGAWQACHTNDRVPSRGPTLEPLGRASGTPYW